MAFTLAGWTYANASPTVSRSAISVTQTVYTGVYQAPCPLLGIMSRV